MLLSVKEYVEALGTELTSLNGNGCFWYGGANAHKPFKHFTLWTILDCVV